MKNDQFDVVIIGGGSAGIAAAEGAQRAGARKVCIIEAGQLGGECPYEACVPTKAMLAAAKLFYALRHDAGQFGIRARDVTLNFADLMKRKDAVVRVLTGDGKRLVTHLKHKGVKLVKGRAVFADENTVMVGATKIRSKSFVIATGSKDVMPPVSGLESVKILTYRDLVRLKTLPESVAILGAGPVGSEFSTFFGLLGVRTALIQPGEHILSREDAELSVLAEERLQSLGVHVFTKTVPLSVKQEKKGVRLTYQVGRKPRKSMLVQYVVVATGKRANVDGLGLDLAGVEVPGDARLKIDKHLRTSAKHIFVAGDATSTYLFTHTAHHEGFQAGWNAARVTDTGNMYERDLTVVPRVTFVVPELASVGMTAEEAAKAGLKFNVLRAPMSVLGRAAIEGKRNGLLKVIVEEKSGLILGAHLLGERAGEIIHELTLAMQVGIPFAEVSGMIHAYPTYSEIIPVAM